MFCLDVPDVLNTIAVTGTALGCIGVCVFIVVVVILFSSIASGVVKIWIFAKIISSSLDDMKSWRDDFDDGEKEN